jgi:hypothetical protein
VIVRFPAVSQSEFHVKKREYIENAVLNRHLGRLTGAKQASIHHARESRYQIAESVSPQKQSVPGESG